MSSQNILQQRHGRRGVTLVLVVVMLFVMVGFTALSVDVGLLYNTRTMLQNTADAAALASAQDLGGLDPDASIAAAFTTASEYIERNRIWNNQKVSDYTITFGESVKLEDGSGIDFTPGVIPANSVEIIVYYDLQHFFHRSNTRVSATAIAGIGARDFMIVIDASGSMTKQTVEADVCADLQALGIVIPPPVKGKKPSQVCKNLALSMTFDDGIHSSEFWSAYMNGDPFMPPSIRVLPSKSAKDAAAFGVEVIRDAGYDDLLGTASFAINAPWAQELTSDYALVRAKIRGLTKFGGSDISVGILTARDELMSVRAREGTDKVMIVFADGQSNEAAAITAAQLAADDGISIYTVGLGTNVDQFLLGEIARIGNGTFQLVLNNVDEAVYAPQLRLAFASVANGAVKHMLLR